MGSGSFGTVVYAKHMATQTDVAIKLLRNSFHDAYSGRKVISEIQIMRKLTERKSNCFTTLIYDVIIPEIDPEINGPIDYLFIVMNYEENDLK